MGSLDVFNVDVVSGARLVILAETSPYAWWCSCACYAPVRAYMVSACRAHIGVDMDMCTGMHIGMGMDMFAQLLSLMDELM